MSQNDYTIANQGFPAFRADLNSALQAIATNNSGATEPSTMFANMWWYDSANNILYIRNEDNDAWIKFAELDQTNDKFILSGTLQLDDGTVSAPALTFNSDTNMGLYRGGTDILKFVTAGTDALIIDASQILLVGQASQDLATSGISLNPAGYIQATTNSVCLYANRTGSDGSIINLYKDNSAVGTIGNAGARLFINSGTVGLNFAGDGSDQILPSNAGANRDNAITLGATNVRFKDLYLSGGAFLGGTGAVNLLDDYEEGVITATASPDTSGSITFNSTNNHLAYTKVGRMVTITGLLVIDSVSSPAGTYVRILGLPFTIGNLDGLSERTSPCVNYFDQSAGAYVATPAITVGSVTEFRIWRTPNTWSASDSVYINFSYFTA